MSWGLSSSREMVDQTTLRCLRRFSSVEPLHNRSSQGKGSKTPHSICDKSKTCLAPQTTQLMLDDNMLVDKHMRF